MPVVNGKWDSAHIDSAAKMLIGLSVLLFGKSFPLG